MTHCEPQRDLPHPTTSGSSKTTPDSFEASAQPLSLADVLQTAPTLLQSLHSGTLEALLSTSRLLRRLVHEHVSSIIIRLHTATQHQVTELQVLTGGNWPCLQPQKFSVVFGGRLEQGVIMQLSNLCLSLTSLDFSGNSLNA